MLRLDARRLPLRRPGRTAAAERCLALRRKLAAPMGSAVAASSSPGHWATSAVLSSARATGTPPSPSSARRWRSSAALASVNAGQRALVARGRRPCSTCIGRICRDGGDVAGARVAVAEAVAIARARARRRPAQHPPAPACASALTNLGHVLRDEGDPDRRRRHLLRGRRIARGLLSRDPATPAWARRPWPGHLRCRGYPRPGRPAGRDEMAAPRRHGRREARPSRRRRLASPPPAAASPRLTAEITGTPHTRRA